MAHKGSYRNVPKSQQSRVGAKISKLVKEGEPHQKAVAMALNMARAGRLTKGGGYKRAAK